MDDALTAFLTATPVATALADHVGDLAQLFEPELYELPGLLDIPAGWQMVALPSLPRPSRLTVCDSRPGGGYRATEALSVFQFTGMPPRRFASREMERWFEQSKAESVATYSLISPTADVEAVRGTGFVTLANRRVWLQSSFYLAASQQSHEGVLIEQVFVVESDYRARIRDDIADLGDSIQTLFQDRYANTATHTD